jgi:protein TonB
MKNANHTHDVNATGVHESHLAKKNDLKVQKNSLLRFSVSLMLSLFIVYTLFQVQSSVAAPEVAEVSDELFEDNAEYVPVFQEEVIKVKELKPEPEVKSTIIYNEVKQVENDKKDLVEEILKTTTEAKEVTTDFDPNAVEYVEPVEKIEEVPFSLIEDAPIYPGCEKYKTKVDRKKCMSKQIQKHINRKFDVDLASELGLDEGKKRIDVLFVIGENGNVTGIQSRAPHPKLKKEAERVIKLLPKMEPGKQRDKNVKVKYTLPIIFRVN